MRSIDAVVYRALTTLIACLWTTEEVLRQIRSEAKAASHHAVEDEQFLQLRAQTRAGYAAQQWLTALYSRRFWTINPGAYWPDFNRRNEPLVYTRDALEPSLHLSEQQLSRLRKCLGEQTLDPGTPLPIVGLFEWRQADTSNNWLYTEVGTGTVFELTGHELRHVYGRNAEISLATFRRKEPEESAAPTMNTRAARYLSTVFKPSDELFSDHLKAEAWDMIVTALQELSGPRGSTDALQLQLFVEKHQLHVAAILLEGHRARQIHIDDITTVLDLVECYADAQTDVNLLDIVHNTDADAKQYGDSWSRPSQSQLERIKLLRQRRKRERRREMLKSSGLTFDITASDRLQLATPAQITEARRKAAESKKPTQLFATSANSHCCAAPLFRTQSRLLSIANISCFDDRDPENPAVAMAAFGTTGPTGTHVLKDDRKDAGSVCVHKSQANKVACRQRDNFRRSTY